MSKADNRRSLGKIISVTADRFVVELNAGSDSFTLVGFDGQHYVARIGSFVLVPLQTEYVVAEVVGLRERELGSHEQLESDIEDTHALKAVKFLDIVPMGTLPFRAEDSFKFGVSVYPPLYSEVLYTKTQDLDRILEVTDADELLNQEDVDAGKPPQTRLKAFDIGTSVVFDDYTVKVRVDEFFGGHSAILGNTGSGKSCTVATIVQSIFEKPDDFAARGASFVFFDTNGEYRQAFNQLPTSISRTYALVPGRSGAASAPTPEDENESTLSFRLPHWYLSDEEWELLLRASDKAQRPVLRTALGLTSLFSPGQQGLNDVKNHVLASAIISILQSSDTATNSATRIQSLMVSFSTDEISPAIVNPLIAIHYANWASTTNKEKLDAILESHLDRAVVLPNYENRPFEFSTLGEALDLAILYEEAHGNRHIRDYCSSMLTRFKSISARKEFQFMRPPTKGLASRESSADLFVERLLGLARNPSGQLTKQSQLTIVDMNEVEDEIVEVVSSVITRMIFERLRKAQNRNGLPVNLVLEEAHRYISDRPSEYALDATKIFERVAKEGRKYGLFITLASQRPSELSKTVLSQCSNFVVHRIQNPEDLQHVRRMTPFISESVLSRLPSLPKQHALIFGNSVNVPTTFRVRDASPTPKSDDAKIRETWFVNDSQIYTL